MIVLSFEYKMELILLPYIIMASDTKLMFQSDLLKLNIEIRSMWLLKAMA